MKKGNKSLVGFTMTLIVFMSCHNSTIIRVFLTKNGRFVLRLILTLLFGCKQGFSFCSRILLLMLQNYDVLNYDTHTPLSLASLRFLTMVSLSYSTVQWGQESKLWKYNIKMISTCKHFAFLKTINITIGVKFDEPERSGESSQTIVALRIFMWKWVKISAILTSSKLRIDAPSTFHI